MRGFSVEHSPPSTHRFQNAIKEFKKKQADKSALENKLGILKQKYDTNRKKQKNIKTQLSKINSIKITFQRQRIEVQEQLSTQAEQQAMKIRKEKTFREQTKENMNIIRNLIQIEKADEYQRIKNRTRDNQMRITKNMKQSLHEKKQRSLEVKLKEESSRLNRTIYLQKKRLTAQSRSQIELAPIKLSTSRTNTYIRQMHMLELQMTEKLKTSRNSLSSSKMSLNKTLR